MNPEKHIDGRWARVQDGKPHSLSRWQKCEKYLILIVLLMSTTEVAQNKLNKTF